GRAGGPPPGAGSRGEGPRWSAECVSARDVVALEARGSSRVVRFGDCTEIAAHAVVLATGVSYRSLDAPGVAELTGRGVFYGSAATEAPSCAGQDVYIVGGANSAGQAAVFFSRHAATVTLLVRGPDLEASMSHYLIKQLDAIENVHVRTSTEVAEACGDGHLERLVLSDRRSGEKQEVDAASMFVFIGAAPRTEWLDGVVTRDERGFVRTGPDLVVGGQRPPGWPLDRDPYHLESSVPGVFVAGDVRSDSVKRVASAVGEGAMAVTLVHRYLADQ
ncbi:MAG: NAD(P)/FAD-dependent oxidoreductase, partial [Pseudonocardiales bacterium]|nr:NAD(P)/FAD-dependent oxidoreductase [Pseudonocardiales bacterium]